MHKGQQLNKQTLAVLLIFIVSACSTNYGRYQQKHDSTPTRLPTAIELKDAVARAEPKSRGGNKNYQVRGKSYQVLSHADNFKQSGIASWYGRKFHGHLTSNGERYNMYGMSAAHKNLPLPTYVKVTNNDNHKTVIVRVNDRGPFHQERIIDLSYSAAYKLDMLKTGTANVTIEAITDFNQTRTTTIKKPNNNNYIQVFATKNQKLAHQTSQAITGLYQLPANSIKSAEWFKVQIGPIEDITTLNSVLEQLKSGGYPQAFKVQL